MKESEKTQRLLQQLKKEVEKEVMLDLPRRVGTVASNHFKQNFREGGFVNGGLHKWKITRRQLEGGNDAKSQNSPLTSGDDHLMRSIQFKVGRGEVTVENPVKYAAIHNEGGEIPVTAKMKRFAWYKYYSLVGRKKDKKRPKKLPSEAKLWMGLALTKKKKIIIPQRQFIGESKELTEKINKIILASIKNIQGKLQNGIRNM